MKAITSLRHLILYALFAIQIFLAGLAAYLIAANSSINDSLVFSVVLLGASSYLGIIFWCIFSISINPADTKKALSALLILSIIWIFFSIGTPAVS